VIGSVSRVFPDPHAVRDCFAAKIGAWFRDDAMNPIVEGIDEEGDFTGPSAPGREWLYGAGAAFADVVAEWAYLDAGGTHREDLPRGARPLGGGERDHIIPEIRGWLDRELTEAEATRGSNYRAAGRAWALKEARLWLDTCARLHRPAFEDPA
jgi:hypothetical protein